MKKNYKCIFAIVNTGFSEVAMDSARSAGATGGTILTARGTASKDAEKFFGKASDGAGTDPNQTPISDGGHPASRWRYYFCQRQLCPYHRFSRHLCQP